MLLYYYIIVIDFWLHVMEILQVRINELEKEKSNLSRIIKEAKAYIDSLD